jgi:regulator of replication initiation timing
MQNILTKLQRVEEKVIQLTQKMEYLKKENIMLIEENVKLKKDLEKNRGGNEVLKEVVVQNIENSEVVHKKQSEQLRRELDKHIVEIDNCIELINNM